MNVFFVQVLWFVFHKVFNFVLCGLLNMVVGGFLAGFLKAAAAAATAQ